MNRGLIYLLGRTAVGRVRFGLRRLKTVKGCLLALLGGLFFTLLLAPQYFFLVMNPGMFRTAAMDANVRLWGPVILLLMMLSGIVSGRGLYFRPAEINLLFPAPVSVRQLLLYLLATRLRARLISALLITVLTLRYAAGPLQGLAGIFLALTFMECAEMLWSLTVTRLEARFGRRARTAGGLLLLAGVVAVGVEARRRILEGGFAAGLNAIRDAVWLRILTVPVRPYVELFTARDPAEAGLWLAASGGLCVLIIAAALALCGSSPEAALSASARLQARLDRVRQSGVHGARPSVRKPRLTLPLFPRLGGAGALAWRQSLECLRNLRHAALMLVMIMVISLFPFYAVWKASQGFERSGLAPLAAVPVVTFLLVFTVLNTQAIAVDFRRDLDRMAFLRSLPLSPFALVLGELAPGVLLLTVLQGLAITAVHWVIPGIEAGWSLALLLLLIPMNTVCLSVDNTLFLLAPYRLAPKATGDFQFMGRILFVTGIKSLVLMLALAAAGGVGAGVGYVAGRSVLLGAVAAAIVLMLIALPLLALTAFALNRFDVAREIPD